MNKIGTFAIGSLVTFVATEFMMLYLLKDDDEYRKYLVSTAEVLFKKES